ncbi:MAG: LamG domain-containing protein [Cytophaga sp.]|uniref:LamG domain-containing protein n=1 Tax=Cytophaga sp. TaxID=29535 RepID=UPI003F7F1CE9
MFSFDPAHTQQLELSLKCDYRKGVPAQRYIIVPNAFAWVDSNGDGLGDFWLIGGGTPSIVTGNGFAGRAQRLVAGAAARILRNLNSIVTKGAYYRLRFRWRAGINLQVCLGNGTNFTALGANTGNAVFFDGILRANSTAFIEFSIAASDYAEVSEIELWEVTPARFQDEGQHRNIHGILYSGKAFQFDGVSTYMDCGNPVVLQVSSAFSICFWIKFAVNGNVLVSRDDNGSNRAFQVYKDSSGKLNFVTVSGASVSTLTETTATVDDEIWHRVVCTYNGSTKAVYVDGSLSVSGSGGGSVNNAAVNLFIGKLGNNSAYLSGGLCDVQLWNKALDSADVLFDFQYPEKPAWQRNNTNLAAADLVGHWWMAESYGYYAFDYSGNRNDSVLYGVTALTQQKDIPQPSLMAYSQKIFFTVDAIVRNSNTNSVGNIWNNGGKLHVEVIPYSDGESDQGTIMTKTSWLLRCEGESAGKVKLRFIVLFSSANGEWVTTNTEVPLKQLSSITVEYNSSSAANVPVIKVNGTTVVLTTVSTPAGTYTSDTSAFMYVGDTSASTTAFEGLIDNIQLYNNNVLKGSWYNEGMFRWSDLSGNNNLMLTGSANKELFLIADPAVPGTDILGFPLTNTVTRHGANFDMKTYSESSFCAGVDFNAATEDFSFTAWVRFARIANGATQILISMQTSSTSGFAFYLDNNYHLQATLNALKSSASTSLTDINWHFIVCTVDRDDKMKIYLDGSEVTYSQQDNLASAAMNTNLNPRLGIRSYGGTSQFKGQLAGVTLHRKVLSAEEQKHLYAFGKEHYS